MSTGIRFDSKDYKAVVSMRIDPQYNQIPDDSFASIQTQGLLGGKYIGLSPGGLGHLPEERQPHRSDPVGYRAREPDQQVLRELREQGSGGGQSRRRQPDATDAEQVGVEEMRYAIFCCGCWRHAGCAAAQGRPLAQAPAAPRLPRQPQGPDRRGADRRAGHAQRSGQGPRRLPHATRRRSRSWWTSTCCRTSTPSAPPAWCSASTGAPPPRSSASASSMPSTTRC